MTFREGRSPRKATEQSLASGEDPAPGPAEAWELPLVPARHVTRWVWSIVALAVLGALLWIVSTNPNFGWRVVGRYLLDSRIMAGLRVTVILTVTCMFIGIVLGVCLAIMKMSAVPLLRYLATGYVWFFRGTPVLVQLIFWFNLAALFPNIGIGSFMVNTNAVISPMTAAILGLGLNEGAYMSEIVRAGILSVSSGQSDAGRALGLQRSRILSKVVLPQAMRVIIPPTGNETIGMLKTTALVSVIALADLLYSSQQIYSVNYETIPLLIVVSLWYLLLTSILTSVQSRIERYYGRGFNALPKERAVLVRILTRRPSPDGTST